MKKLVLLAFLLVSAQLGYAETLFEKSFKEMGFSDFTVENVETKGCTDYSFILPSDLNVTNSALYPIFSLNTAFYPVAEGNAKLWVELNDENIFQLYITDFRCSENNCWKRLRLPKEKLLEENSLRVCVKTSSTVSKVVVSSNSMVGVYKMAEFKKKDFVKSVSKRFPFVGEKVTVRISLKNSGSEAADVNIVHMKPIVEEKIKITTFKVLKGESEWSGSIASGEEKIIEYTIRPEKATDMTLPAAIVFYKNIFGEEESLVSNYPMLSVRMPKIEAYILKDLEINEVGHKTKLQVAVKNKGRKSLFNGKVKLSVPKEVKVFGSKEVDVQVEAGQTTYINFEVSSFTEGKFDVSCNITFSDYNIFDFPCEKTVVEFQRTELDTRIFAGTILIAVAVAIYLFIHFQK